VAFQCKRWNKNTVGRPEIDKFRGAIQGQYEQGLLFTTGSFAAGAEAVSFRPGAVPIILIDGPAIVDMMIEKQFGVQMESLPIYSYALDLALSDDE
jgi:restriction system protein